MLSIGLVSWLSFSTCLLVFFIIRKPLLGFLDSYISKASNSIDSSVEEFENAKNSLDEVSKKKNEMLNDFAESEKAVVAHWENYSKNKQKAALEFSERRERNSLSDIDKKKLDTENKIKHLSLLFAKNLVEKRIKSDNENVSDDEYEKQVIDGLRSTLKEKV